MDKIQAELEALETIKGLVEEDSSTCKACEERLEEIKRMMENGVVQRNIS